MLAHRDEARAYWRWAARVSVPVLLFGVVVLFWPRKPAGPVRLEPELFRDEIETIDSVLYRGDRLTPEDRATLSGGLNALGAALARPPQTGARRRARAAMEAFLALTAFDVDHDRLDVVAVRHRWQALRGEHFRDAAWFEHGSAVLEDAQRSSESRGVPPDAAAYEQTLESLRGLFTFARVAGEALPSDPDDVDMAYEGWQQDRERLKTDVGRIRESFPLKRDEIDPAWKGALLDLNHALDAVSLILGPDAHARTLMPTPGTVARRVQLAENAINKATDSVARAPR